MRINAGGSRISSLRGRLRWSAFCAFITMLFLSWAPLPAIAQEKQAVIKLWDHHIHDKKFRQAIFKEFNRDNPDIKVEYTSQVASALETMLTAAFNSKNPPDIFVPLGVASLPKMVELGWVIPMDDLAPSADEMKKWISRFPKEQQPFAENINMWNGKVYSWPTNATQGRIMLFWNTKLFQEAGLRGSGGGAAVPETLEDVRLFAKKITELGGGKLFGIIHGVKNPGVWDMDIFIPATSNGWPHSRGWDFRTGRFDFHNTGFRNYIKMWLDMKDDGSIFPGDLSMDDEQAKFRFTQDLVGMIFGGPWIPGGFLAINADLQFDVVLPPTDKRGVRMGYVGVGPLAQSSEYAVSSKTENKAAVWRVIQFMTSQKYQEEWVKAGGGVSVFPEYNKTEFFPHFTIAKVSQMGVTGRRIQPPFPGDFTSWWSADPGQPSLMETMQGQWVGKLGYDAWDDLEKRWYAAYLAMLEELRKKGMNIKKEDFIFPDWNPLENWVEKPKKK